MPPTQLNSHEIRIERLKLLLLRKHFTFDTTLGELFFVDYDTQQTVHLAYTLEDGANTHKVWGETCIPSGTYEVVLGPSKRFKRILPRLLHVPNYDGILIHGGNDAGDTLGCILVGTHQDTAKERIWDCAEPLADIIKLIGQYEKCTIEIL